MLFRLKVNLFAQFFYFKFLILYEFPPFFILFPAFLRYYLFNFLFFEYVFVFHCLK